MMVVYTARCGTLAGFGVYYFYEGNGSGRPVCRRYYFMTMQFRSELRHLNYLELHE
jgi:hypothetical protein